jgi:hypothetical protein
MNDNDWLEQLKVDLVRVNQLISMVGRTVDNGIDRLRRLERERELIISKTLGETGEDNE